MQSIENQTLNGSTVFMDGKYFINCRFERCTLIYGGGDYGWRGTQFVNCTLNFEGHAARTFQYLAHFGMLRQQGTSEPASQPPTSTPERVH